MNWQVISEPNANNLEGGIVSQVNLQTINTLEYGKPLREVSISSRYAQGQKDVFDTNGIGKEVEFTLIDQLMEDTLGIELAYNIKNKPIVKEWQKTWDYTKYWDESVSNADKNCYAPAGIEGYKQGGNEKTKGLLAALQWSLYDEFELNFDIFQLY